MREPVRLEPTEIYMDPPTFEEIDVRTMDAPDVPRYVTGLARAGLASFAVEFNPTPLAKVGTERLFRVGVPRLKMGPRGLRVRFRGKVVAADDRSITVSPTSPLEELRIRASRGWRRHLRREKAAKRRLSC
jgi:hypothetical protein